MFLGTPVTSVGLSVLRTRLAGGLYPVSSVSRPKPHRCSFSAVRQVTFPAHSRHLSSSLALRNRSSISCSTFSSRCSSSATGESCMGALILYMGLLRFVSPFEKRRIEEENESKSSSCTFRELRTSTFFSRPCQRSQSIASWLRVKPCDNINRTACRLAFQIHPAALSHATPFDR